MQTNKIMVDHLSASYQGNQALNDISFSFDTGQLIGIIGPNGAGKSTLMKAMLELIPRDKGIVQFGEKTVKQVRKNIAYVPQRSNIDWDFPIIVRDTVLLGTYPRLGLFHRPKHSEKEKAMACLKEVGMEDYAKRQIGELSGGQQQRVFLARALAQDAAYFFLDEPFVGIDVSSEGVIIKILKDLKKEGKTIFVVHHDLAKVNDYFDDLILINKKLIGAGAVKEVFQPKKLEEAYQSPFQSIGMMGVGV